ncbi:MAG: hypothetical protein EPO21_01340 [Chloroflexota bacterium]|nr:MAG: hypothetical protein EPO21_01340 [Chloroflexota bacterium]
MSTSLCVAAEDIGIDLVRARKTSSLLPALLAIGIVVSLRVGLSLLAWAVLALFPLSEEWWASVAAKVSPALRPGDPLYFVVGPWQRWDALFYERIAGGGYAVESASTPFWPLYPILMRLFGSLLGQNWALAGLVISGIALAVGLFVLWHLVADDVDPCVATRTVVYMAIFPTAFFFFAPYTEALFLALMVTSFYFSRKGWWWLAGACGFAAALTRPHGVVLLVPLAWEFARQHGWRWRAMWSRDVWHLALILLAPLLFTAYTHLAIGASSNPVQTLGDRWGETMRPPWESLWQGMLLVLKSAWPLTNYLDLFLMLGFLALSILSLRLLPVSYGLLGLSLLAPSLVFSNTAAPLSSTPRFVLVDFPCFMLLALAARRRIVHRVYVIAAFMGLLVLTAGFVRWAWIA